MTKQVTIKKGVNVQGINVYNGGKNYATFFPAEENSGLVFLVNNARVPAKLEFAEKRGRGIALNHNQKVYLVEHLLSAVYALGIDNLEIELSDSTCPTTDNCAKEYVEALKDLRIEQGAEKKFWKYSEQNPLMNANPISIYKKNIDRISISKADDFIISYLASYPHKCVGDQKFEFKVNEEEYFSKIMAARSPVFFYNEGMKDISLLGARLGFHGVNDINYLIIPSKESPTYSNPEGFEVRYDGQEVVRHKMLDVIGTLALTGRQFKDTRFDFERTGHMFDLGVLKDLFYFGCFKDA